MGKVAYCLAFIGQCTYLEGGMEGDVKAYDFLRGTESYKLRTANHVAQNMQITFDQAPSFSYSKRHILK